MTILPYSAAMNKKKHTHTENKEDVGNIFKKTKLRIYANKLLAAAICRPELKINIFIPWLLYLLLKIVFLNTLFELTLIFIRYNY